MSAEINAWELDEIEKEYLNAISRADTDEAYYLSLGLKEYRELYKLGECDVQ